MLTKRWLILVAIFLLGMTTNSLSVWGQSVAQNTHFQGGNWLDKWLSGPLPGQPQHSTTSNQIASVSPTVQVSDQSEITSHRKSQETAQRPSSPYQPQDLFGDREQQETPKRLSILEDMREPENIARGFYVGGGLGYSLIETGIDNLTGSAELDEEDFSYKVFAGYKFNKYLSAELFYMDLGEASLTGQTGDTFRQDGVTTIFPANATAKASATAIGIATQVSFPVTSRLSPFVKVGGHYWEVEGEVTFSSISISASDEGFDVFFGGGVEIALTKNLSVRGEYENFTAGDSEADIFTVSGLFKF